MLRCSLPKHAKEQDSLAEQANIECPKIAPSKTLSLRLLLTRSGHLFPTSKRFKPRVSDV